MRRIPVLCLRCHTDQVMKGGYTKVHICNTTGETIGYYDGDYADYFRPLRGTKPE